MSKDVQVNMRCPTELVDEIDEIADALGVPRSEVVRRALSMYAAQARPVINDLKAGRGGLWSFLFGPSVRRVGDETDERMLEALNALTREMKKSRKTGPKGATA